MCRGGEAEVVQVIVQRWCKCCVEVVQRWCRGGEAELQSSCSRCRCAEVQRCRWWIEMLRCGGEDNVNVKVKIWLRC